MNYDAIIVGGGLGGLTAGAILARRGKKVILLEQHYIPGGCATTFKRKDFIMEAGLHAMDGWLIDSKSQQSILRFLGIKKQIRFEPLPDFYRIKTKHIDFTFPHGTGEAIEELIRAYPDEEPGIRGFFDLMLGVLKETPGYTKQRKRQILLSPLIPFLFPYIHKTSKLTLGQCLDKYFMNDELKLIIQGNLLYYHDDPYSMSMAYFAKAQASFIHFGGYFIRGGSQKLSDSLAEVIRKNNGTVLLGKKVSQIVTTKGKATGVSYRDAFNENLDPVTLHSDHIIFSGALPLVSDLLTGPEKAKICKKIGGLEPSCALFSVYIGFKKEINQIPHQHYSTFIYGDDVRKLQHILPNNYGDWHSKNIVFVDYSQIDSGLAPKGKSFGVICAADRLSNWENLDDHKYKKKKEEIARILLDRLEKIIPGINGLIEYHEVATPRTIRRYTLNPAGAPYGYAQTPGQTGAKRLSHQSPVKNLWFSGAWTFPGGGFTGAMVSGFLCGFEISKRLDKDTPGSAEGMGMDPRVVKLVRREEIAQNTIELTFEKPEGFIFLPGQYAFVSLDRPKYQELDMPVRPLSIASHPDEDLLRFIMRKSPSSFKRSCAVLGEGETATIYGPAGNFILKESGKGKVFLVAGIGISPVLPLLKELVKQNFLDPVYLFYSNRTEAKAAYHHLLRGIELQEFHYKPVYTESRNRINEGLIKQALGDPEKYEFYIVGTTGFLNSMAGVLKQIHVNEENIHMDDFG